MDNVLYKRIIINTEHTKFLMATFKQMPLSLTSHWMFTLLLEMVHNGRLCKYFLYGVIILEEPTNKNFPRL